jgi:hypothetical protein
MPLCNLRPILFEKLGFYNSKIHICTTHVHVYTDLPLSKDLERINLVSKDIENSNDEEESPRYCHIYHVLDEWKDDIQKFIDGKLSKLSVKAKAHINSYAYEYHNRKFENKTYFNRYVVAMNKNENPTQAEMLVNLWVEKCNLDKSYFENPEVELAPSIFDSTLDLIVQL